MKARIYCRAAVGISALGLLIPPSLINAAEPTAPARAAVAVEAAPITDVALGLGGTLTGQVVNASGQSVAGITVTVRQQDKIVASTLSRRDGKFAIPGLSGGIFQIAADQGQGAYRLWAPQTAPPAATQSAMLVHDARTVRGQSAIGRYLSNPFVIAAIVAAAIAIPVAVHNISNDHGSGS